MRVIPLWLWALHWSALVPLIYLLAFKRSAPRAYWWLALGFSVSVFAGVVQVAFLDLNWRITHFYPLLQFALFAGAASYVGGLIVLLAGTPMVVMGWVYAFDVPELVFAGVGSALVISIASREPWSKIMLVYCGVGTLFYLALATEIDNGLFYWLWTPYQICRLVAFGLFIAYVERQRSDGARVGDGRVQGGRDRVGALRYDPRISYDRVSQREHPTTGGRERTRRTTSAP